MTALTANVRRDMENAQSRVRLGNFLVATSSVIFDGAFVVNTATQTVKPASNTAPEYFLGMAVIDRPINPPQAAASITGDGVLKVEVITNMAVYCAVESGITAADRGKAMWCQDDNTMGTTVTNGPEAGYLVEFISEARSLVFLGRKALAVSP